jgi:hypothetical protein
LWLERTPQPSCVAYHLLLHAGGRRGSPHRLVLVPDPESQRSLVARCLRISVIFRFQRRTCDH